MSFENRSAAGRGLATALAGYKASQPVVLALPRGGVPVAAAGSVAAGGVVIAFSTGTVAAAGGGAGCTDAVCGASEAGGGGVTGWFSAAFVELIA